MKSSLFLGLVLSSVGALVSVQSASACDGGQCTDRTWLFNDLINFSRGLSNCPTLSDDQALQIASQAVSSQIDYEGFKSVYQATCNLQDSLQVAAVSGQAPIFTRQLSFSQSLSNCPTFNDPQALQVANEILYRTIDESSFDRAYQVTCNLADALQVSRNVYDTNMFTDLLSFSQGLNNCPTFNDPQLFQIIAAVDARQVDYNSFKSTYQLTCNFSDSLTAGSSPAEASAVTGLITFSQSLSNCPTLNDQQAIDIANRSLTGEINLNDFKESYQNTCDLNASLVASRCLNR